MSENKGDHTSSETLAEQQDMTAHEASEPPVNATELPTDDASVDTTLADSVMGNEENEEDEAEAVTTHTHNVLAHDDEERGEDATDVKEEQPPTPHPYRLFAIIGAAAVIGITMMWFAFPMLLGGSPQQIGAARTAIQSLYHSRQQDFLSEDISPAKLEQVKQQVDQLHGVVHGMLQQKWQQAENGYQAIIALNDIYQSNVPMIKGETLAEATRLKAGVTKEQVEALKTSTAVTQLPNDSKLSKAVMQLLTQATTVLDQVDTLKSEIAAFKDTTTKETAVEKNAEYAMALENRIKELGQQVEVESLSEALTENTEGLCRQLLVQSDKEELPESFVEKLLASKVLMKHLNGSALDSRKLMSLTFDDGPNPEYTTKVLDILKKYNVKATFFVVGGFVEQHPEVLQRIVAEGHQVGNHTYTHPNLATLSDEKVKEQIQFAQEAIYEAAGVTPKLYRLPFGSGGARVVNLLKPMTSIIWNVDSEDWKSHDSQMIIEKVLSSLQKRSVMLMHDTHISTVEAIDYLIPVFKEMGYQFVFPEDNDLGQYYY